MKLDVLKIICGHCGKEHTTENFELVPMMGDEGKRKDNQVYMYDTGTLEVNCECGYIIRVDKK